MKKKIFGMIAIMLFQAAGAQIKEGKIIYEQKIDMHRRMQDEQMKAMIPQFRTSKYELNFADNQSIYKIQEEEPDISENTGHGNVMMKFAGANAEYYKNFSTQKQVEKRELADKDYVIEDSLRHISWKLEDETKTVLGYNCKKASGKTERGSDVIAWYTEEIQMSSGPESFNGLPGMILQVDINKKEFLITAVNLEKTADKKELKVPSKGKKISPSDFAKLQKDLFGNQSGPVIRINNN
ncbi:MAG TPA: GLPGLI family protein [Chitinophagaceae bacterium]|nr:GLPGLI family protein [Chitinophagaceae bacterium]